MGIIETIKMLAVEEAEEKGMEKGIEKGIEQGIGKGIEKSKQAFVENLLRHTDFSVAKIATLADVTEAFILKVKGDFNNLLGL